MGCKIKGPLLYIKDIRLNASLKIYVQFKIQSKAQTQLPHTAWLVEVCAFEILSELCETDYSFDFRFVLSISHVISPDEGSFHNYQAILFLQNQREFFTFSF